MNKTGRTRLVVATFAFLLPFIAPVPSYCARIMQGSTRSRTAAPAVNRVSPARAKTVHKATPKSLLVVKRLTISPKSPHVGDKVAIHAFVSNNGAQAVRNVKVAFYLGRRQVAWAVYDIRARSTQDFRGFFTQKQAPRAGNYTVKALVDPKQTLERKFYKGNSATLRVAILPPVMHMRKRTVNKAQIQPKSGSRHAFIRPGQAVDKGTRSGSVSMRSPKRSPEHTLRRLPPGKILNVTVRTQQRSLNVGAKTRRQKTRLDIHWARRGVLPTQVDILLYAPRQLHKSIYLRRNAVNNGHFNASLPYNIRVNQKYIVRVQTHDGKVYGNSKPFSCSSVPLTTVGTYAKSAASTRRARAGGRAATPISIPRPIDTTAHTKLSGRGGKNLQPLDGQVKLDPGQDGMPKRYKNKALTADRAGSARGPRMGNLLIPYGPAPTFSVIAPKQGDTWLNNKSHEIKWINLGSSFSIKSITLRNALSENKIVATIFPANSPIINGSTAKWTVPSAVKKGNYFIRIEVSETVNGKTKLYNKDSGVFIISWPLTAVKILNPDDAIPGMLAYAKDMPHITYFDYNKTLSGCAGLHVNFYWKDGGENLHGGTWTLEWKDQNGWQDKSGQIAKLPYPADFLAGQGFCKYTIPFCEYKGKPTPFRFFLTDAKGLKSNVISGTVNAENGPKVVAPPPVNLADVIEFVNPSSGIQSIYFPGEKISIQFKINADQSIKTVPITLDLLGKGKFLRHIIKNKVLVNNGKLKTVSWTVPPSFNGDGYQFAAEIASPKATVKSGRFKVAKQGITLLSPQPGATYNMGDTITFKWEAHNLPPTAEMTLLTGQFGSGAYSGWASHILVKQGTWKYQITPGEFPSGKVAILLASSNGSQNYAFTFIHVLVPKTFKKPVVSFEKPAPWQTTKWLAGTTEKIVWTKRGDFPEKAQQTQFYIEGLQGSKVIRPIDQKMVSASSAFRNEILFKIPADIPSGPYYIRANLGHAGIIGQSNVIEIVGSDMTTFAGPAYNTKFTITKIDYPSAGGALTVHVRIDAPKPFRLGLNGSQKLGGQSIVCQISNFKKAKSPEIAAFAMVSVKQNPSVFPKYMFPKGVSNYVITFTPKLIKPLYKFTTTQHMPGSLFGPGNLCVHHYPPKLEISLTTYLPGGSAISGNKKIYLKDGDTNGIGKKFFNYSGEVNLCAGGDKEW